MGKRAIRMLAGVMVLAVLGAGCDQPKCRAPSNVCTGKDSSTGEYTPKGCVVWNGC